jgi:hypothetical protein
MCSKKLKTLKVSAVVFKKILRKLEKIVFLTIFSIFEAKAGAVALQISYSNSNF